MSKIIKGGLAALILSALPAINCTTDQNRHTGSFATPAQQTHSRMTSDSYDNYRDQKKSVSFGLIKETISGKDTNETSITRYYGGSGEDFTVREIEGLDYVSPLFRYLSGKQRIAMPQDKDWKNITGTDTLDENKNLVKRDYSFNSGELNNLTQTEYYDPKTKMMTKMEIRDDKNKPGQVLYEAQYDAKTKSYKVTKDNLQL